VCRVNVLEYATVGYMAKRIQMRKNHFTLLQKMAIQLQAVREEQFQQQQQQMNLAQQQQQQQLIYRQQQQSQQQQVTGGFNNNPIQVDAQSMQTQQQYFYHVSRRG